MAVRDIIVIGASAGCVEALAQLARKLPADFPAPIFIVCHIPCDAPSALPAILSRAGPLRATHARDGEAFDPNHIYVAPPDHHLVLKRETMRVERGPREHGFRPAIDPLFRSAARVFDSRVIGVVLTGAHYDGVAGLLAVRAAGGVAVIQDPKDAFLPALPKKASAVAGADHIVSAAELAGLLVNLVHQTPPKKGARGMTDPIDGLPEVQAQDAEAQRRGERRGAVSVFTCPECGGSLWQVDQQELVRFRCHVGHVYDGEALLAEQADTLEAALWTALRTFKDRGVLSRQLADRERERGHKEAAGRFDEQAHQAERYGESIRQLLLKPESNGPGV
jgi:two-component system chemotaxis response regulator CheB